jgi:hypothetical protein
MLLVFHDVWTDMKIRAHKIYNLVYLRRLHTINTVPQESYDVRTRLNQRLSTFYRP